MKANRKLFPDHHLSFIHPSIHESGGCRFSLSGPYLLIFEELMVMPFILGCENFILGFGCGI
jgi:hypothetical protein